MTNDMSSSALRYVPQDALRHVYDECSAEERRILDTINAKVAAAESLDATMNFLFEALEPLGACDRLGLSFLEEDAARVVAHWARAAYDPILLPQGYTEDMQGSSLATVLQRGMPRVINDLERYAKEHPNSRSTELIVREGIRSSMTCPLVVEGRPVGFLFRSSRKPNAYDDRQVRMHLAVSERLSQAVEKAYRIEQLTAANQAYFETLGFVSHELRSPLASLIMESDVLLGGYVGDLTPDQKDRVGRMVSKANYLLNLVKDYMDLAQVESGNLEPAFEEDVDVVAGVIRPAVDIVQPQILAKQMTLTERLPEAKATLRCDPGLLQIVLVNLLSNAAKYGNDGGEIRLTVEYGESLVDMTVWNAGPGFPPEQRGKLFRRFSRVKTPELMKRKGTGIGLYTSWRIIQAHQGRIRARSEHGHWAEFSFTLPRGRRDA